MPGAAGGTGPGTDRAPPRRLGLRRQRLAGRPAGTAWSVNVPDVPLPALPALREARLCDSGAVRVRMVHRGPDCERPGGLRALVSEHYGEAEPGTDVALLAAGHPTITELAPIGHRAGATGYPG